VYVRALLGVEPGRGGKVRCPFHADDTPSLHVYPQPEQGRYCFGCRRGGSIYDLAAEVWGRATQGRDFLALREDLDELLEVAR
jgi:DNA primase